MWWLLLTGLSWIPYAFGCATCLVAPSSSCTIRSWRSYLLLIGLNYIVQDLVFTCYPGQLRNNFMCILQSISYCLQGSYVLSVELPSPKTTTYGLHFFLFSLFFFFYFKRILFCNFSDPNLGPQFLCRMLVRSWAAAKTKQHFQIFHQSFLLDGNPFQHSKIKVRTALKVRF